LCINFIKALATIYDLKLIRVLFTNPHFKLQNDASAYYVYKIIELTVSDHLQEWNQYSKFKSSLQKEFRVAHKVIESMIKDYVASIAKLRI